ncbi:hypothetical protein PP707_05420 [Acetobacter pasteurianus]|nr:hypothetical protein [Acetobacter pasteurianus]
MQLKVKRKKNNKSNSKREGRERKEIKRKSKEENAKCLSMSNIKTKVISMTRQITEQVKLKKKKFKFLNS